MGDKKFFNRLWRILPALLLLLAAGCSSGIGVTRNSPGERRFYELADHTTRSLNTATVNLLNNFQLFDAYENEPDRLIRVLEQLYQQKYESAVVVALADTALQIGYRFQDDPAAANPYFLAAAVYSGIYLKQFDNCSEIYDEQRIRMIRIYNLAATELFFYLKEQGIERQGGFELAMPGDGRKVRFDQPHFDLPVAVEDVEDFTPCANYRTRELTHDTRVFGIGVPMVATLKKECRDALGIQMPGIPICVTMVADFHYDPQNMAVQGEIRFLYARTIEKIRLGERCFPLAADFSTPLAQAVAMPQGIHYLRRTLQVEEAADFSGLFLYEPYDENRIPVVFVHGLMSDIRTWGQMLNTLLHDNVLRQKYQFLGFAYSSGNPILYSGAALRSELLALRRKLVERGLSTAAFDRMILVGHSMGGLLSRLQISSCTVEKAARILKLGDWEDMAGSLTGNDIAHVAEIADFEPLDCIQRVIFIAVPHRGSEIARSWVGALGASLITLPIELVRLNVQLVDWLARSGKGGFPGMGRNTGIDNLRPDAPALLLLNELEMAADVPVHSVIGNRDAAGVRDGTDGIVPYWSSHLETAVSEVIVHSGHSAQQEPLAIQEVRRILQEHLTAE